MKSCVCTRIIYKGRRRIYFLQDKMSIMFQLLNYKITTHCSSSHSIMQSSLDFILKEVRPQFVKLKDILRFSFKLSQLIMSRYVSICLIQIVLTRLFLCSSRNLLLVQMLFIFKPHARASARTFSVKQKFINLDIN